MSGTSPAGGTDRPVTGNEKQIAYWNEVAGPKWVRIGAAMEARLAAVEDLLMARAAPKPGEAVLEIGCGTGITTLRLAEAVGPSGHVVAVDVSRPMLEAAQQRLAAVQSVTLIEADASRAAFDRRFDLITSRFGVMFFGDPTAAFAHLRGMLTPEGRLCCLAWAPVDDNPHWSEPLRLAKARLGPGRQREPGAPGPLAFDDPERVRRIFEAAGFAEVDIAAEQVMLVGRSLDEEADIATRMGPAGALLEEKEADQATRDALRAECQAAMPGYADILADGRVRLPATVHVITARRD